MAGNFQPTVQNGGHKYRDLKWSRSEKAIARKAFDGALKREFEALMREVKQAVSAMKQPADLWELEHLLTQRRKQIDRKYQFPGSRRTEVLGRLLYEKRLTAEDLNGLAEDKLVAIRSQASGFAVLASAQ